MKDRTLLRVADTAALTEKAAALVLEIGRQAVREHGIFRLALTGGSTPRSYYQRLSRERESFPWERVRFYFGDERSVPPDHPESNYRMANEALLEPLGIDPGHVFRMKAETDAIEAEAADYEAKIRAEFGDGEPRFDLILLGMGEDGHTASLFPHTAALGVPDKLVVANHVPQKQTWRMTMTYPLINAAHDILFTTAGANKAPALKAVLEGDEDIAEYPSQGIRPTRGRLTWLVDEAAAALLTSR